MAATSKPTPARASVVESPPSAAQAPASVADGLPKLDRLRRARRPEIAHGTRLLGAGAHAPHLLTRAGTHVRDAVAGAAELIASGAIVAVKGLRGYQLACRADEWAPVRALRTRKRCEERPFALMVPDVDTARRLLVVGQEQAELLHGSARGVVLASKRADAVVAPAVAPGRRELGVMLPYTPLQHLLLSDARELGVEALAMASTSLPSRASADLRPSASASLRPSAPVVCEDEQALARVRSIADAFLVHDRAPRIAVAS